MTEIILFHHILGLTDGVRAVADELRQDGHTVHTPDLFDGRTFATVEEGRELVQEIGFDSIEPRAEKGCEGLPTGVVYAGFSLGAGAALHMAGARPGARGVLMLNAFADPQWDAEAWRSDIPVHCFTMDEDPFLVEDGGLELALQRDGEYANLHVHHYPGAGHLFLERGYADHDEAAARQAMADVRAALREIG